MKKKHQQVYQTSLYFLFSFLLVVSLAIPSSGQTDHSMFFQQYDGAQTCAACHPNEVSEIHATTHYKFESPIPENYLFNEDGSPKTLQRSGKLWKLCGYPTTFPQFNWMGQLKDDPATPNVDKPGGCAKCHVGIGIKPFTAVGQSEPQANEMNNVDCLICHAENYQRKFYVATTNGEPDLNASGAPVVFVVPRVDGEFDFSVYTEAAKTVGPTKSEYCLRCHAAAGGGKFELDNMEYSFKRGAAFTAENDVHAAMGMTCSSCHSTGNEDHQMKRSLNNDLFAYDNVVDHQMCTDCHGDAPHSDNPMYNNHADFISCTACHAQSVGGAVFKDFSTILPPDPNDPLGLYAVELQLAGEEFQLDFQWFNGTVTGEIDPHGSKDDGESKIYPYKLADVNQPVDEHGEPIPVKWGKIFVAGDLQAAMNVGRESYAAMYTEELAAETGIPPVPGEHAGFKLNDCLGFSISHGITKEKALTCACCHDQNSVLDFEGLGYTSDEADSLRSLAAGGDCPRVRPADVKSWTIHNR